MSKDVKIEEAADEIVQILAENDNVGSDVVEKAKNLKNSAEKTVESLKNASSEAESRKNKINKLQSKLDERDSKIEDVKEKRDNLLDTVNRKDEQIEEFKNFKEEVNMSNKKRLKRQLKQHSDKLNKASDFMKSDVESINNEDSDKSAEDVVEELDSEQVMHDLNKMEEYASTGLLDAGSYNSSTQSQDQFQGGEGPKNISEEIKEANSKEELNKIKQKVEQGNYE